MVVLWKNKLWSLDMSYQLFAHLQEKRPNDETTITELTASMYKEEKRVPICELRDWSVERNLSALGRN